MRKKRGVPDEESVQTYQLCLGALQQVRMEARQYYITPAPNAMPKIYDPLKDYKPMVLDALNIGLMIRISSKRKVREAIMNFSSNYGLLGLMTTLPTTPKFVDYKAVSQLL